MMQHRNDKLVHLNACVKAVKSELSTATPTRTASSIRRRRERMDSLKSTRSVAEEEEKEEGEETGGGKANGEIRSEVTAPAPHAKTCVIVSGSDL